ncbi:hypothetical protein K435DRAFT_634809, partial [Dendrothele bispora CBS 962.96]
YSYKLQSHTTNSNFAKLPHAFPANPLLLKIDKIHSCIATLSGIKPEIYHTCINSCICYVGTHESCDTCPFCKEKRLNVEGSPCQIYIYNPIIPRLQGFTINQRVVQLMQY